MAGRRPPTPTSEEDQDPETAYAPKHTAYGEGNSAYARRQAARLFKLATGFEKDWEDVADFISMGRTALGVVDEDDEFLPPPPDESEATPADEDPIPPRPAPVGKDLPGTE